MKAVVKTLAVSMFAVFGSIGANAVFASGANGVSCPANSDGNYQNGVLKCKRVYVEQRASVCPIGMVMNSIGSDKCESLTSGPTLNSRAQLFPTDPANPQIARELDAGQGSLDRFNVTFTKFEFPNGSLLPLVGNADRGVKCPSGSTARTANNEDTLVCESERRNSACLGLYVIDKRGGVDKCIVSLNGKIIDTQPTVPSGELTSIGWTFDKNGPAGGSSRDQWVKYVDPVAVGF